MKKVLIIGAPKKIKKDIESKFALRENFEFVFRKRVQSVIDDMTITSMEDGVDIVVTNLRSDEVKGGANFSDYASNVFCAVRDTLEIGAVSIITCNNPGNRIAGILDAIDINGNEKILVAGKMIADDLEKLFNIALGEVKSLKIHKKQSAVCA